MYPDKPNTFRLHNPINFEFYSQKYPVFVPIRNPIDSIASYLSFYKDLGHRETESSVKQYANEYINFYSHLKKYKSSVSVLLFEDFTNDITNLTSVISSHLNEKSNLVTDEDVKKKMNKSYFKLSLPRNNKESLKMYKEKIYNLKEYTLCQELFDYFN